MNVLAIYKRGGCSFQTDACGDSGDLEGRAKHQGGAAKQCTIKIT